MGHKYLPLLMACAVLLTAGCGNMGVSGQGGSGRDKSGGGSVNVPFFTSRNAPETHAPVPVAFQPGRVACLLP